MAEDLSGKQIQETEEVNSKLTSLKEYVKSTSQDVDDAIERFDDKQRLLSRELKSFVNDEIRESSRQRKALTIEIDEKINDMGGQIENVKESVTTARGEIAGEIFDLEAKLTGSIKGVDTVSREAIGNLDRKISTSNIQENNIHYNII